MATRAVPRPARPRPATQRLRLTHALIACDLNAVYLDCWPLAQRAWRELAGLEPVLVLVAAEDTVPEPLRRDPTVHVFKPVDGLHSAFQAQCIRLLYPGLLELDGGVVTSDIDMLPLQRDYFHRPAARIDARHFLAYRDVLLRAHEIPICYNAALPAVWRALFQIDSEDDARAKLAEWGHGVAYEGVRGGRGWETDQRILYRALLDRAGRCRDVWILADAYTGYRRLERHIVTGRGGLDAAEVRGLERCVFSDFHCALPQAVYEQLNEQVLNLALKGLQSRAPSDAMR